MRLQEAFDQLNISLDFIPAGSITRPGTRLRATHITIHNTANPNPGADALMHARYLKGDDAKQRKVSWHFTVDDKRCVKHLPTNEVAFHAVSGNSKSIGIEICEHQGINQAQANERASLLTAVLMFQLNIPPENVVPHKFWTGKHCPHVILDGGGFETFRQQTVTFFEQLQSQAGPDLAALQPALAAPGIEDVSTTLVDQPVAGPAPGMSEDHVAELERLVGRLTVENEALRRALLELQTSYLEAD